jgi:hypothetical protein
MNFVVSAVVGQATKFRQRPVSVIYKMLLLLGTVLWLKRMALTRVNSLLPAIQETKNNVIALEDNAKTIRMNNSTATLTDNTTFVSPLEAVPTSAPSRSMFPRSFDIGSDSLFWIGKGKICDLIRNITDVKTLGVEEPKYVREELPPPLVNLTLSCDDMVGNTGNWITALYHLRLVAALGRVDFQFQCESGMESVDSNLLPWFSGRFPAPSSSDWPYDYGWPDPDRACSNVYAKLPLHHLAHEMQRDMQSIAIAMLGSRNFNITRDVQEKVKKLEKRLGDRHGYPRTNVDIDDAAIHFRCGDVFGGTNKDVYGLIKFREYSTRIPNATTRSIGIHTQPFNASLVREADQDSIDNCEKVVHVLVDYLQARYPNATITIRNTQDDTLPMSYARMTMAQYTITSMSTFGIFPAIGSFGEGFYQKSGRQNRFAEEVAALLPNLSFMNGPILSSPAIRKSNWTDIIAFLTSD